MSVPLKRYTLRLLWLLLFLLSVQVQAQLTCNTNLPEATPTADFTLNPDGTAVHNKTGLMWMRCTPDQDWDSTNATCTGSTVLRTWSQALTRANIHEFAGFDDWRLPNIKELASIVESQCLFPSFNTTVFPYPRYYDSADFWSASGDAENSATAWGLAFDYGGGNTYDRGYTALVRLVRGGQLFDDFNSRANSTTITSDNPDPSVVGQAVTVAFTVTSAAGTPTGNVTVNADSGESCIATVVAGSCQITFSTVGAKTLTASYAGDANFDVSDSADEDHTVKASTSTSITSDNPDPSVVGQAVTVAFTVTSATGTPTGNVTVNADSGENCTATVAAGSCEITFTTAGAKTLTASYAGDANFDASDSADEEHTVNEPWLIFTGPAPTGGGDITATLTPPAGQPGCQFDSAELITLDSIPDAPPPNVVFPYGLFGFSVTGCQPGFSLDLSLSYPETLPDGTQYWKYGPTADNQEPHWYTLPVTSAGAEVSFSITDGGLGDSDLSANGSITDPGGVARGSAALPAAIPALEPTALALLVAGLLLMLIGQRRRQLKP